jgi:FixJ family two-component response regulator
MVEERLTPRETEVLKLIASGDTDKTVAARLGITFRTAHPSLESYGKTRCARDRGAGKIRHSERTDSGVGDRQARSLAHLHRNCKSGFRSLHRR